MAQFESKSIKKWVVLYFGTDWHFTLNDSKWFVSKVVDPHFQIEKNAANSLARPGVPERWAMMKKVLERGTRMGEISHSAVAERCSIIDFFYRSAGALF